MDSNRRDPVKIVIIHTGVGASAGINSPNQLTHHVEWRSGTPFVPPIIENALGSKGGG